MEVTRLDYNLQAGVESPDQPAIPLTGEHVWHYWWELNSRRQPGFDTLAPLTYMEIESWMRLTGKQLDPVEIRWLTQMDDSWLATISQEQADKRDREKQDQANKGSGR